MNFRHGDTQ